jgi:hypothetical protein
METHTATIAAAVTVEKIGRRHYLTGDTYAHKDAIRDAGCKWDPDQRAWWTGNAAVADTLAGKINALPASAGPLRGSPTMLRDGSWGVRVFSGRVAVGSVVSVVARGGKSWDAIVSHIERLDGDTTIVATTRKPQAQGPTPQRAASSPAHRHTGRCRAAGCRAPTVVQGYCRQCHFDEYDC